MTAPALAGLLDRLIEAREAAHLGTLRVGQHYGIHLYAGQTPVGTTLRAADAACLVAEHNALPALTSALRAVLDYADQLDAEAVARGLRLDRCIPPGDALRAAVTDALGGAS